MVMDFASGRIVMGGTAPAPVIEFVVDFRKAGGGLKALEMRAEVSKTCGCLGGRCEVF
jgi:hypothetical protein